VVGKGSANRAMSRDPSVRLGWYRSEEEMTMRKLLVTTFVTVDGVMQAPGGPEEDPEGNFPYGGWSVTYWDETMNKVMDGIMGKPFDLLLGRKTYDIFAGFWPHNPDNPGAPSLNDATKYVVSGGDPDLSWGPSVLIDGDVAGEIAALKAGDGPELQVHGSGGLIQTLLKNNLVDEFHLHVFPVVLGTGKRLFADGTVPAGLKLVDSVVSSTGVFSGTYEPTGELKTGTFDPNAGGAQ
jgi:dihydrofolate reductase